MKHQQPIYPLRMPDDLKAALQKAADENMRSLNGEILYRLTKSVAYELAAKKDLS